MYAFFFTPKLVMHIFLNFLKRICTFFLIKMQHKNTFFRNLIHLLSKKHELFFEKCVVNNDFFIHFER